MKYVVQFWSSLTTRQRWIVIAVLGLVTLVYLYAQNRATRHVPGETVWSYVERQSRAHDLEPGFVYAIAFAESSFDAHARSSVARGMMQLTRPAWETASPLPYAWAWDWRHNVHAGVRYLAACRRRLEAEGRVSYPLIAACYRYGFGHVRANDFDLGKIRTPGNNVYRKLFAGERSPIPPPE